MEVINGNERGSRLEYINEVPLNTIKTIHKSEVFLDNTTGDFYELARESNEWQPRGNVGLHYIRSSEIFGSVGAFFQKQKQYHSKAVNQFQQSNLDLYETTCFIKKAYIQHWIIKGIGFEFKVPKKNKWDPHPINIQFENASIIESNYYIIAESDRGPQIIEHKNTIATQFHIDPAYPESIQLLKNFVSNKLGLIQLNMPLKNTLENVQSLEKRTSLIEDQNGLLIKKQMSLTAIPKKRPVTSESPFSKLTTKFIHSGENYSKRRAELVVSNNAFGNFVKINPLASPNTNRLKPKTPLLCQTERARSVAQEQETYNKVFLMNTLKNKSNLGKEEGIS